jgi:monothiol glutaredoxin
MTTIQEKIAQTVQSNPVVLYMKGTADFPQCGFSSKVVQILRKSGIQFLAINVLDDPEIRQGIKDYTNWPTIPQLYVNGEFIGGCDIVTEMDQTGELQKLFAKS